MTDEQATQTTTRPLTLETADDFSTVVTEHGVVLVDFYADWCGPCQMFEPILETVAQETPATVLKVDSDRFQQLAAQHGVRGIPTTVLYADGEPRESLVGVHQADEYASLIDQYA
ncbi:thioredoxin [Halogranum rubrum]|uniref:Thioredoxin n=1 Tax=Halogranum rubrum TaxID=553466 RepID=A0A1I4C688_9EURY|nr:thioredoxin family protein [Halogranum rubrum]SFK76648.1 thioredoxin [Halogranum rubrum]